LLICDDIYGKKKRKLCVIQYGYTGERSLDMDINGVSSTYAYSTKVDKGTYEKKNSEVKSGKEAEISQAAVYEKSEQVNADSSKQIYKMSKTDREAIVKQMKDEMFKREQQLVDLVKQMIGKQGNAYAVATGDDIWKFLASGDFTVDAATKEQAQKDIAEDGYWGVEQTSQRIFDFACALAGDDVEAMEKMQKAFEKGFKEATGAWGKELPDISQKTRDAVNKKFDEYYNSKKEVAE